jgi:hypothetical protein
MCTQTPFRTSSASNTNATLSPSLLHHTQWRTPQPKCVIPIPYSIYKLTNNITLTDSLVLEAPPHRQCQLLFGHSPLFPFSSHRRALSSYAWVREQSLVERTGEGCGSGEIVRDSVGIQQRQWSCIPRHLPVVNLVVRGFTRPGATYSLTLCRAAIRIRCISARER